jgi:hypothetical protein
MQLRLRTYTLREGLEAEFIEKWNQTIVPLRHETGFEVLGAWYAADEHQFTWLVGWPGEGPFDEAEEAYYASPGRAKVTWDAGHFVAAVDVKAVEDVFTTRTP